MARFCKPVNLLTGVAIISLFAAELRAQSSSVSVDPSSCSTKQNLIQRRATLGAPAKIDEETIRSIVRDELKREKSDTGDRPNTRGDTDHSKKNSEWFEVGKDLQLNTIWNNGFVAESNDKA